jgi:Pyruvate/2-oxoacid:ferredoxin oxidoreductase gamma subunit
MANMAMMGAVMKMTGMLPLDPLIQAMIKISPPKIRHLIEKNRRVLERGYASV